MKRQFSLRATPVLFAFVLCLLLTMAYFPIASIFAANSNSADTAQSTSKALLSAQSARTLNPTYAGKSDAVAALKAGATPVSLALRDLDADGAPDLVAGYTSAKGGVIVITRGNPDAFAPTDATLKKLQGKNPDALLSKAVAFAVPVSPDLIVTGDFNRDAKRDVLVAARDGAAYLLAGDGKGNLLAAKQVPLAGVVTAMAASADGHIAVSLMEKNGWQLVILNPSAAGLTTGATYSLPARGDSLAWGNLGGGADLAVGAGANIVMIYGPLGTRAQTETVNIPYEVHGLEIADFVWDRDGRNEVAILAQDGSIQILQHGTLDTRPLTAADAPGRRSAMMAKNKQPLDPTSLGVWRIAKQLPSTVSAPSAALSASAFSSPRLAPSATSDLMVIDSGKGSLKILDTSSTNASPRAEISFPSAPVAALALPQKFNGERDVVALTSGQTAVTMMPAGGGDPTFNVNTTADEDDAGACPSSSTVTTGSGPDEVLSLREAICEANNVDATSVINVPAGTYSLTISTDGGAGSQNDDAGPSSGEIQVGTQSGTTITIAGAGTGSTIIQQTNTSDRVFEQDAPFVGGVVVIISNLTIQNGDCTTGLDCGYGGGAMLGGGNTGDNLTLTNVVMTNNLAGTAQDVAAGGAMNFGANGILTITGSTVSNNTAVGDEGGGILFLENEGSGSLSITGSSFLNNVSNLDGGGLAVTAPDDSATVSGSIFTGNSTTGNTPSSGGGGGIYTETSITVSNSRIVGNTGNPGSGFAAGGGTDTVTNNWWGCNAGPAGTGCDTVTSDGAVVTFNPWIVLGISANPNAVNTNGTSALTADLTHNSNGVGGFSVPDGTPVTFGGTLGTASPTNTATTSGQATSTYTAGNTAGPGTATATVDGQEVTADITISTPAPVFAITKSHIGSFTQGDTADTYTITLSNNGPGSTTGTITFFDTLPTGLTAVSFAETGHSGGGSGADWSCSISPANCLRTTAMPDGETDTFTLTVSVGYNAPTGTNAVTNQVQVSGGGASNSPMASDPTTINVGPGYVLSTSVSPSGSGTVTANPTNSTGMPTGHYVPGAVVTLTANPAASYAFSSWSSNPDLSSTSANPTTITMNSATESVTANFTLIIVAASTSTSVSSNNNPSFTAPPGNSVTFTATVTSNSTVNEGTVMFSDAANDFTCSGGNTVPVSNGQATCTTSFTTEGSRVITGSYSGTVNFQFSSGMITQVANNHTAVNGNQFCNPGPIIVPSTAGAATPYPSNIFVTGLSGNVGAVTVNLNNVSSSNITQTDLLLVGPTGAQIIPFASVGDGSTISGVNVVLDDAASSLIPGGSPLVSGSYKPTSITGSTSLAFPAPAPLILSSNYAATDGTATLTSTFQNTAPNGTWALYAMDNAGNGAASIGGGWCVNITPPAAQTTITTTPAGLLVSVDGGAATAAPLVENWIPGSSHTIATTSPQAGASGVQYVFSSWSDGGSISHSITVQSTATTYTASFATQYQLTTQASPSADGTVTPASGGYYASGASIPVTATANSGFTFSNWSSTGGTFDSNTAASTNFHMPSAPATVTGNFANASVQITITTTPANLLVSADGGTATAAPLVETWVIGSSHTIATTSPQSGGTGVQYVWSRWSDSGAISHSITVPGTATTYTASFATQYQLTTAANPGSEGTVSPASGTFYPAGTVVPLKATPNSGYEFKNWTGHVASSTSASTSITMTGPQTATANFSGIPGASLSPSPVAFGTVYLNRVHSKVVTLTNGGTGTLDISNISLTPTGGNSSAFALTKTCGATLAAGKNCSITIGLSASMIGTDTATLNVTDNAAGNREGIWVQLLHHPAFGRTAIRPGFIVRLLNFGSVRIYG